MTCEKCWADAFARAYHMGGHQVDHYHQLLAERKDNPCSPEEQRAADPPKPEKETR
jgi:predicted trehalose synthase